MSVIMGLVMIIRLLFGAAAYIFRVGSSPESQVGAGG
jgi:hypothetical protein